jgi:hypothetical protein
MLKYPRFANLAWSVLALHVPAQNRNNIISGIPYLFKYNKYIYLFKVYIIVF